MKLRKPLDSILNRTMNRYRAYLASPEHSRYLFGVFQARRGYRIKVYKSKRKMLRDFGVTKQEFEQAQTYFAGDTGSGDGDVIMKYKNLNGKLYVEDIVNVSIDWSKMRGRNDSRC